MRSLIPQLLNYMVSPYDGKPTVAGKKVRGGGPWDAVLKQMDDEMDADDQMRDANPAPPRHGATARQPNNPAPPRHRTPRGATKRTTTPPRTRWRCESATLEQESTLYFWGYGK